MRTMQDKQTTTNAVLWMAFIAATLFFVCKVFN